MKDASTVTAFDGKVQAVLEGGPTDLPPERRHCRVDPATEKVKLPHRGGYEHFERQPWAGDRDADTTVYRWVARTEIAE